MCFVGLEEENNIMLPNEPADEPLAQKIVAYKTGAEENEGTENDTEIQLDDDGNPIYTQNSLEDTNEIENSSKQEDGEEISEKFFSHTSTPAEIEEISAIPHIFGTVSSPDDSIIPEIQMHLDTTSNISESTSINSEEVVSKGQIELNSGNSISSKTVSDLEHTSETEAYQGNEINMENNNNGVQRTFAAENLTTQANRLVDQYAVNIDRRNVGHDMIDSQDNVSQQLREQAESTDNLEETFAPNTNALTEKVVETLDQTSNSSNDLLSSITLPAGNHQVNEDLIKEDGSKEDLELVNADERKLNVPDDVAKEIRTSDNHEPIGPLDKQHDNQNKQDLTKEFPPFLDESTERLEEQLSPITNYQKMSMYAFNENMKEATKLVDESTERMEDQLSPITNDQKMHTYASIEDMTEEDSTLVDISRGHSENQHVSLANDHHEETVKPLEKEPYYAEDIFSDHSKEHHNNIFNSHSDKKNEKSWYDRMGESVHEVLLNAQSTYTSFFSGSDELTGEQCERNIDDGGGNHGFCSQHQLNELPTKLADGNYAEFVQNFTTELIKNSDLKILLLLEVVGILIIIFGHHFFVNRRTENALVSKLNATERRLFTTEKECSIAKSEVFEKRKVLDGIADKSFGTDDMIKQLEGEKAELREQIYALEKELEAAAEAGLELNKMVAELLSSNQNGSDSIINSVEELQQQLNDQEATSIYINNLLAEKSRENSELKVALSETNKTFGCRIDELMHENKLLCEQKESAKIEMANVIQALKFDLEEKMNEITQMKEDYSTLEKKYDEVLEKWQSSSAQAEALKMALSQIEHVGVDKIKSIQDMADANAKYLAAEKGNKFMKECLSNETDMRKRLQSQVKELTTEISQLRSTVSQNEKEKLEALTRLDVLSSYFKEKETQLQRLE